MLTKYLIKVFGKTIFYKNTIVFSIKKIGTYFVKNFSWSIYAGDFFPENLTFLIEF